MIGSKIHLPIIIEIIIGTVQLAIVIPLEKY